MPFKKGKYYVPEHSNQSFNRRIRLSYTNLTAPVPSKSDPNGKPKYSVTILIPKSDTATKADLDASFMAAYNEGITTKWGGARPQAQSVIHDGDGLRQSGTPYGEECKGHWVLTASSINKPQVVGIDNINCELAPSDIYSGMYGRVTINFYPYNAGVNKGVGCGLGNVLKTRDGEVLSGGATAASDFNGLGQSVQVYPQTAPIQGTPVYQQPVAPVSADGCQSYNRASFLIKEAKCTT